MSMEIKGSLRPNVTPSVPPPNVAVSMGSMSAWERWIATTFAPGTPVKLSRGLSWVGRANAAQGVPRMMHPVHPVQRLSLGVGTRLEVIGRAVKTPGHAGSWWIPAVVTDARDPSGLRLPHDGTRVDVEWQHLEPLVDNWALAQQPYTGRKLKGSVKPNRRTSRGVRPNVPLQRLVVPPPPSHGDNHQMARWLHRTFAPGTPVKVVGNFQPYNWGWAIPHGARGEAAGPCLTGLLELVGVHRPGSWSVSVKITDARDPSGLQLSQIIGRWADIPWEHVEPLVDNWASAQSTYKGRKLKGVRPNRRTSRGIRANIALKNLSVPPPHNKSDYGRWLNRAWAPGTSVDNWASAPMGHGLKPNGRRHTTRSKELDRLVATARSQGWTVEMTTGNHLRWLSPDPNQNLVITGSGRSDPHAIKNIRARLRRAGLRVNPSRDVRFFERPMPPEPRTWRWPWRWKERGDEVYTQKTRGGELSVAPYDTSRSERWHVVFFAKSGEQLEYRDELPADLFQTMEVADAWADAGFPDAIRSRVTMNRRRSSRRARTSRRRRRVSRNADPERHRCRVWCYDYRRGWRCESCDKVADRRTARWLEARARGNDQVGA